MSLVKGGRHLVFVYGTLKRGEPNHHWLRWDTFDKIVILVWRKKTLKRLYSQIAKVKVFFRAFDFKFFDSIVAYSISSYEWYWKTQTNIIDDYCSSSENGWQEFQGEAVSKHRFPLVIASRQKNTEDWCFVSFKVLFPRQGKRKSLNRLELAFTSSIINVS